MRRIICGILALVLLAVSFSALGEVPEISITKVFNIPDNEALRFTDAMGVGWNLGNTFDSSDCTWLKDDLDYETGWGCPVTTRDVMKTLRETGYRTVRIPVSWHNHVTGDDFIINEQWMDRVQTVVDWALEEGLYVILNTHHDVSQKYYYPIVKRYEQSERYITSIWSQIAERFRDYGDHLIFEGMNEPRMKDTQYEWYLSESVSACRQSADCINRLNQAFVDTVRASGGNNAERYLMVTPYDASPDCAQSSLFVLPEDTADNKLIVSVHSYSPLNFALEEGGVSTFSLESQTQKAAVANFINLLYSRYIANGIPVVIGEFGARDRNGNLQDRVNLVAWYTASARVRGIPCILWDNGAVSGSGELFAVMDRKNAIWYYPEIAEAMIRYQDYRQLQQQP